MSWQEIAVDVQHAQMWAAFYRAEAAFEGREHPDFYRADEPISDEVYDARLDRLVGAREDKQR